MNPWTLEAEAAAPGAKRSGGGKGPRVVSRVTPLIRSVCRTAVLNVIDVYRKSDQFRKGKSGPFQS